MKEIMIKDLSTGSYEHEFTISDNGELWTSDDKLWTSLARNKRIMSVDDNGNGYAIIYTTIRQQYTQSMENHL